MIGLNESALVLFILGAIVVCADWPERRPAARLVSGAIMALLLALALGVFWLSNELSAWASEAGPLVPAVLIVTTLALILAQFPAVHGPGGAPMLGNALGTYLGLVMAWVLQALPSPISAAHAIPPPPDQVVADCAHPTYASDMLVCADPDLLGLDRQMADALKRVRSAAVATPGSLVEAQDAWFRRRSRCAFSARHADCLRAAYAERIMVLDVIGKASVTLVRAGTLARCSGAPWGPIDVRAVTADGPLIAFDSAARVLAVALDTQPSEDWASFVRFVAIGETIRLSPLELPPFECRVLYDSGNAAPRSVPATGAGS